jgi:uncharacterized protein DUF3558
MRRLIVVASVAVAAALAGCGGGSDAPTPAAGTPENPLKAMPASETGGAAEVGATAGTPSYKGIVDAQSKKPRTTFTPCNLVTKREASAIMGVSLQDPIEAPQGPTCIYQGRGGDGFTSVAVQSVDFDRLLRQVRRAEEVQVGGRTAYCGMFGQPTLVMRLAEQRVLTISAQCSVAKEFAAKAIRQL